MSNVLVFPRRVPPEKGKLWGDVLKTLWDSKRAHKVDTLARKVGANPVLVGRVIGQLMQAGFVYDRKRAGGAA